MDIYVVLDGPVLVGASARLQGAELLRVEWADREIRKAWPDGPLPADLRSMRDRIYKRQQIVNTELRDAE